MSAPIEQKLDKIPVIRWVIRLLKTLKLPGLEGLTVYDLLEMYVLGLINGAVSIRASAVAFSFLWLFFHFCFSSLFSSRIFPLKDFNLIF